MELTNMCNVQGCIPRKPSVTPLSLFSRYTSPSTTILIAAGGLLPVLHVLLRLPFLHLPLSMILLLPFVPNHVQRFSRQSLSSLRLVRELQWLPVAALRRGRRGRRQYLTERPGPVLVRLLRRRMRRVVLLLGLLERLRGPLGARVESGMVLRMENGAWLPLRLAKC